MLSLLSCSPFIVCCAKLVFLPAVIAWQLFEEVRDKLQAKYHELQVNSSQVRKTNRIVNEFTHGPCWTIIGSVGAAL